MKISVKPANNTADGHGIQTDWDMHDSQESNNVTIRQTLKLPLICLAIGACFTYDPNVIKTGNDAQTSRRYRILGLVYHTVSLISCLAWCAKCFVSFFTLPSQFISFNVVVVSWILQVSLTFIIYLKTNHVKYGGQRKAFNLWDAEIRPLMDSLGVDFPADKIKRRFFIFLVVTSSYCFSNLTGMAFLATDAFENGFGVYYSAPFSNSVVMRCVYFGFTIPVVLTWVMSIYYVVCVCTLLITVFETFNTYIANVISHKSQDLGCKFHKLRLLQLSLSKMVSELDQDFSYHFAVSFVLNMGVSSYMIYLLLKTSMDVLLTIMFVIWILGCLSAVGVISVFAAFVHEAVRGFWFAFPVSHAVSSF